VSGLAGFAASAALAEMIQHVAAAAPNAPAKNLAKTVLCVLLVIFFPCADASRATTRLPMNHRRPARRQHQQCELHGKDSTVARLLPSNELQLEQKAALNNTCVSIWRGASPLARRGPVALSMHSASPVRRSQSSGRQFSAGLLRCHARWRATPDPGVS
jgi:hypothetical protein